MNSRSLFKLVVLMLNWLKLSLFAFPVVAALISFKQGTIKYGYDFLTVDHNWSIIISIGIGMVLNTWHAIRFEEEGLSDLRQYLKMRQRYEVTDTKNWSLASLKPSLEKLVNESKYWKSVKEQNNTLKLVVSNGYGFKDVVTLSDGPNGIVISSRPKSKLAIVDMARNLHNVKVLSKYLKENVTA